MATQTVIELRGVVHYGKREIAYTWVSAKRKTLEIAVHPDATVRVKAPVDADQEAIEAKLRKRARWIVRQQDFFNQFNPRTTPRFYLGGETHLYLGRHYQLKVGIGERNQVHLKNGVFEVQCWLKVTPQMTQRLLNRWYAEKAAALFRVSLDRCWPKFETYKLYRPSVSIKRMRTRWGSLSESGTLTLNVDLVKAPKECIDYVITHELCHLIHHDHSPAFYGLLDALMPDWRKMKQKLELRMA